jgi:hypothetical protein
MSFSPKFVKAKVSFRHENKWIEAGEHLINTSGVPGFAWNEFNPMHVIGNRTKVHVELKSKMPYEFDCFALFTCEETEKALSLGLSFILPAETLSMLNTIIAAEGVLPDFVRKFPRVPYNPKITMMPSRAIVRFKDGDKTHTTVCDIENLSPTGFQMYTEDRRVLHVSPGHAIEVELIPRGDFLESVKLPVVVRRVIHTIDQDTSNNRWYFGVSIGNMTAEAKSVFTDVLRLIIAQMRSAA